MITLEPITAENALVFRDVRLRALKEDPTAFGSTYAREVVLSDEQWIEKAKQWNSGRTVAFLAMEDGVACGTAGSYWDDEDGAGPPKLMLGSMWTAPSHRRSGVGRLLVERVLEWARERGVERIHLLVTANNHGAIRFYESLGFAKTGKTGPYPNDPTLSEYEMWRAV